MLSKNASILAKSLGSGNAGNIVVTAPAIAVTQGSEISSATQGTGNAGTVTLQGDRLTLSEGGQISTATAGTGHGGDITVTARESVSLTGRSDSPDEPFGLQASSNKPTSGNAGNIVVTAPAVTVSQGSAISSATQGTGNAGTVTLQVDRLTLNDGGQISTATAGSGRGGAITVQAREAVLDDGRIASDTAGDGDAGSIGLQANRLTLTNGGSISTNTTVGRGSGGNIAINAAESITLTGRNESQASGIYARSRAPATGNAGNITLTTDRLTLNEGTTITAESEQTSGGNILINARDTRLYKNSTITSSVQGNEQSDGGNVTLNGDKLIVYEGGKITARANQGRGGRITINEKVFLYEAPRAIPDVLDASSQVAGNQGIVTINAQDLNLNSTLVPLPATYLDASKLLSNRCTAPQASGRSSFVVRGRGAVPPRPEGPVPASARECLPAAPEAAEPVQRKSPAVETTETPRRFDS